MAPRPDADDPTGVAEGSTGALAADSPGAERARPPRPVMSDRTPAPILRPVPPTTSVKVSRSLWLVSFGLALVLALIVFLDRDRRLDALRELVVGLGPDRDAGTLDAVRDLAFWGSLGAFAVVVLIEALLVRAMLRGHGATRWALLIAFLAQIATALLIDVFVLTAGDGELYLRVILLAQLVSAGAALVAGFSPGAGAWFRARKGPVRRPRP